MKTNRLEAFSDGVFAVAITLLVLEINVPSGEHLWHQLKEEWPSFASFFVSFWVIGIIWVNHHGLLDHLKRTDRPVLYLNLLVLMTVVFIPFSTALMAEHLKSGADEKVAAARLRAGVPRDGDRLRPALDVHRQAPRELGVELADEEVRRMSVGFMIGSPLYAVAVIMAFISPAVVLIIIGAVAVYYMVAGMRSPDL